MARTAATPSFLGGARGVRAVDAGRCSVDVDPEPVAFLHFLWPSRTLVIKVTMALAGWSGSSSAKR